MERQKPHRYLVYKCNMKKPQRRRKHCTLAVKIFAPPQTPFPGAREGQNLISWRWSLPLPTNPVWLGSMHAISSYRGNRPTHIQTHPPTHKQTGPITIHCAAASVQCNQYCGLIHYLTHPSIFKQYKLADAGTSLWCTKFNNQAISLNDVLISRLLTIPDSGYCLYAYKELHGAASKHPIRACVRR